MPSEKHWPHPVRTSYLHPQPLQKQQTTPAQGSFIAPASWSLPSLSLFKLQACIPKYLRTLRQVWCTAVEGRWTCSVLPSMVTSLVESSVWFSPFLHLLAYEDGYLKSACWGSLGFYPKSQIPEPHKLYFLSQF